MTSFAQPSSTFASLYKKSESFDDGPARSSVKTAATNSAEIYFDENDFSDDDNLDLEFECPGALPIVPPAPNPQPSAQEPSVRDAPANPIPWTSSPPNHLNPPQETVRRPKRESTESAAPDPRPKKRTLPRSWKDDDVILDDAVQHPHEPAVTPAANPTRPKLPWDATQSATKEQRRQFKTQIKKSELNDSLTAGDLQAAVGSHAASKKSAAISLSSEQQNVLDLVMNKGQSVFFTGPAGTGKSVLMRAIIAEMKKKWARDPERLGITASTGLAACNIGGMTLHSFSGIGLGKEDVATLVKKIRRNPKAKNRWLRTRVLVIDEISMVDGELFDKLAQIARTIRNNGRPWGGIQLIITGDFFQLPPVPERDKSRESKFAFDAATWNTSIDHTIGLTQVFRQRDPGKSHPTRNFLGLFTSNQLLEFAGMLNEMRLGKISDRTIETFKALSRPIDCDDGLDVTELFPTRQEVERSNSTRLRALPGAIQKYASSDFLKAGLSDNLLENMMAPKSLDLKKGAQVMLIKNMDDTLVNGTLGKVKGFMTEKVFQIYEAQMSADDGDSESIPKKAIRSFAAEGSPVGPNDLKELPLVQFTAADGTHRTMLIQPEDWKVELPNGEVQAQRHQLPLILAWALSIHKAQGQTLERVKVDLGKVFEKGQAYVALSRAVSKQGLQVLRFDKNKVMAHPRVIAFYNKLYTAEVATKKKPTLSIADFATKWQPVSGKTTVSRESFDLDEEDEMAAYG